MVITEKLILYFLVIFFTPLLGLLVNFLFCKKSPERGSLIASMTMWIGLINALGAWFMGLPLAENRESWGFSANEISWLMATLILFVSAVVHQFSVRYMAGDRNYRRYFLFLSLLTVSMLLTVVADNIIILLTLWLSSNLLLAVLMMHKSQWLAAKNSAILAGKTFLLGLVFLSAGTAFLAYESGTFSLDLIVKNSQNITPSIRILALVFILLAAFTQSGIWPFHSWLISSLNSPTPVSALMHAGLVNGGGLLLARFSPIFLQESSVLTVLFVFACITLILGGIWKLLQSDVKRMLACSTMTQMGFTMMQCSLGLFSAALAHLCWHGLFKAFLFLRSGSTVTERRGTNDQRVSRVTTFILSSLCGLIGVVGFIFGSGLDASPLDTTLVLLFFSWMASTQLAHALLEKKLSLFFLLSASVVCLATGIIYGHTVNFIEVLLAPLQISQPQTLNFIHISALIFLFCIWVGLNLRPFAHPEGFRWWRQFYVFMLNASQPNEKTITFTKDGYKF